MEFSNWFLLYWIIEKIDKFGSTDGCVGSGHLHSAQAVKNNGIVTTHYVKWEIVILVDSQFLQDIACQELSVYLNLSKWHTKY